MRNYFPLLLDIGDRLVVAVGGGAVAARKLAAVAAAGASRLRVVAPELRATMPAGAEWLAEPYRAEHLTGALLVFAATDSRAVNDRVVADARTIGALVNRADDATDDDFSTAATHRQAPVLIAVSAGSAALASRLRDQLAAAVNPLTLRLAGALQRLRPRILREIADPAHRARLLRDLASADAEAALAHRVPPPSRESSVHPDDAILWSWLFDRHAPQ